MVLGIGHGECARDLGRDEFGGRTGLHADGDLRAQNLVFVVAVDEHNLVDARYFRHATVAANRLWLSERGNLRIISYN